MGGYYRLVDDLNVPGRWHLGEIHASDGTEPVLDGGVSCPAEGLVAGITNPGKVLDFSLTAFNAPVATARLAATIGEVAGPDVQRLPVTIAGQGGCAVLNALRVVRCLDEARSEFDRWTAEDDEPELLGQYKQVTKLSIDPATVPRGAHFFRIEGWLVALIVSEELRAAMERSGCVGAKFLPVLPG
jgi:hypothetical protein